MGKKKQIRNLELEVERLRKNVYDREVAIDKLLSDTITDQEKNVIKFDRQFAKATSAEFDKYLLSGKTPDYRPVSKVCDFLDNMKRNPNNISNISEGFNDLPIDEVKVYHRPTKSETVAFQKQGRQYRHTEEGDKVFGELAGKPIVHHKVPVSDSEDCFIPLKENGDPDRVHGAYKSLFVLMKNEHDLILTISEMDDIIIECQKFIDSMNTKSGYQTISVPVGSFIVPTKEGKTLIKRCDFIKEAERLYYYMNPSTNMDVPSNAFEMAEKWHLEWLESNSDPEQSFFDWCLENKEVKPTHIEGGPIPQKEMDKNPDYDLARGGSIQDRIRDAEKIEDSIKSNYIEFKINLGDNFVKEVEYNGDGVIKTKITYPDPDGAPKTMTDIHDDINLMETIFNKMPDCSLSEKQENEILRERISICFRKLEENAEIQKKQTLEISNLLEQRVNLLSEIERLKRMITQYQLGEKRDQMMNIEMEQKFINEVINEANHLKAQRQNSRISNMVNYFTANELAERNNLPKTIESLDRIDRFSYITGGFMIKSKVNNGWNDRDSQFLSNAGVLDLWIQGEIEPDFRVNKTFTEKDVNVWGHNVGDVTFHKSELLDSKSSVTTDAKEEFNKHLLRESIGVITEVELELLPIGTIVKNKGNCFTFNGEDVFRSIPFYAMYKLWKEGKVRLMTSLDMCSEPQECAQSKEEIKPTSEVKDLKSMESINSFITLFDEICTYQGEKEGFTIPKGTSFVKDNNNDYKSINGSLMIPKEVMLESWINNKVSVQYN